jgi:hypothetical protein
VAPFRPAERTHPGQGGIVTVLTPNEKIAARWNGALQARLRQAPLENFLRSRGQKWVLTGDARVTDNLACGTIYLIEGGLNAFMLDCRGTLSVAQHPAVGQITCAVSHGLSTLIHEPHSWRIAALVATARVLAPYSGLDAAAHISAAAAREYGATLNAGSQTNDVVQIGSAAAVAVQSNDEKRAFHVMRLIMRRLSTPPAGGVTAGTLALSYDLGGAIVKSSTT